MFPNERAAFENVEAKQLCSAEEWTFGVPDNIVLVAQSLLLLLQVASSTVIAVWCPLCPMALVWVPLSDAELQSHARESWVS